MIGIGIDTVDIERFRLALHRTPTIARRLFTDGEQAYGARFKDPTQPLAARFAAKEATMKAMGVGLWKFKFKDVEVIKARSGAPSLRLTGKAAELAASLGITDFKVSLTHTDLVAEAVVISL